MQFADGRRLDLDALVFAVGVRANTELAHTAGIASHRGVIVDDGLATSVRNVFAIGEFAEHRGVCYGLVEPTHRQTPILAARLLGGADAYEGSVVSTKLKVSAVRVFSVGDFLSAEDSSHIVCKDPRMGVYRKLVIAEDRVTGAILIGDASGALSYLDLICSGESIATFRDELIFSAPAFAKAS